MDKYLNAFEEILIEACAQIEAEYFQLPVADADAVYRERVYCYELYHQLRCLWNRFPFSLGGEVDKSGHPHFRDGAYAQSKPDLLVHWPGNMDANLACIEVKPGTGATADFKADLKKLTWFHKNARYHGGVFIVYGGDLGVEGLQYKLRRAVDGDREIDPAAIRFLYHDRAGQVGVRVNL